MPETTLAQKIIKLRYINNIERINLARILNCHIDTVIAWEVEGIMPTPNNIEKLCTFFNKEASFFHEYYEILTSNYTDKILEFKKNKQMSYLELSTLLGISYSCLKRILSKKITLSFKIYNTLKSLKII